MVGWRRKRRRDQQRLIRPPADRQLRIVGRRNRRAGSADCVSTATAAMRRRGTAKRRHSTALRRLAFDMQMTRSVGQSAATSNFNKKLFPLVGIFHFKSTPPGGRHQSARYQRNTDAPDSFTAFRVHNSTVHSQIEMPRTKTRNSFISQENGALIHRMQVTQVTGRQLVTIRTHFSSQHSNGMNL